MRIMKRPKTYRVRTERQELLAKLAYIRGILAIPELNRILVFKPVDGVWKILEDIRERINNL